MSFLLPYFALFTPFLVETCLFCLFINFLYYLVLFLISVFPLFYYSLFTSFSILRPSFWSLTPVLPFSLLFFSSFFIFVFFCLYYLNATYYLRYMSSLLPFTASLVDSFLVSTAFSFFIDRILSSSLLVILSVCFYIYFSLHTMCMLFILDSCSVSLHFLYLWISRFRFISFFYTTLTFSSIPSHSSLFIFPPNIFYLFISSILLSTFLYLWSLLSIHFFISKT